MGLLKEKVCITTGRKGRRNRPDQQDWEEWEPPLLLETVSTNPVSSWDTGTHKKAKG